ncbi:hypothetical protein EJ08DRAFT_654066 [Tothia fuscella]|uniref:Uncharacterized protein n=1 Tax=Tothia fuscella TaxID=1048955 RepID=A0A9P4TST1_9PEZI|nr:hypothetical protein EJ08DRAFT_654066 [Tothia fuscella]
MYNCSQGPTFGGSAEICCTLNSSTTLCTSTFSRSSLSFSLLIRSSRQTKDIATNCSTAAATITQVSAPTITGLTFLSLKLNITNAENPSDITVRASATISQPTVLPIRGVVMYLTLEKNNSNPLVSIAIKI